MFHLLRTLLFVSLVVSQAVKAREIISVDEAYPPYMYKSINEEALGLYPYLIKEIYKRMGVEVTIQALPWKRALLYGKDGDTAIGGIYFNQERAKHFDYSKAIYKETLYIYVLKDKVFDFKTLTDLQGKSIGTNYGWSYGSEFDDLKNQGIFTIEESHNNLSNFKKLLIGRVDCIIIEELAASIILQDQSLSSHIQKLDIPATSNHAFIAYHKNNNKNQFIEQLNKTIQFLKQSGDYERLITAYWTSTINFTYN